MKRKDLIIDAVAIGLALIAGVVVHWRVVRIDLTDDRHYTLGRPTKQLLQDLNLHSWQTNSALRVKQI